MKKVFFLFAVILSVMSVRAFDTTPFQFSLWPSKFQIVPEEINVSGLKFNLLFGANDNVAGLDLGIASSSKNTSALQIDVLLNRVHEDFAGGQLGLINQTGNSSGIILGGWNVTDDRMKGIQLGVVNSAMSTSGVQIGLINYTETMVGMQVGLINIITESMVPFFPVVNFCF